MPAQIEENFSGKPKWLVWMKHNVSLSVSVSVSVRTFMYSRAFLCALLSLCASIQQTVNVFMWFTRSIFFWRARSAVFGCYSRCNVISVEISIMVEWIEIRTPAKSVYTSAILYYFQLQFSRIIDGVKQTLER